MESQAWLAERWEAQRPQLRGVAYRMLGSLSEADDAVQEAWIRLSRADTGDVENLGGWLTTVVARVCLDMLRARKSRREDFVDAPEPAAPAAGAAAIDPETEMALADSVGLALLVVLETLPPAERVAFVLHDLFDLSFDEIGPVVGRTPTAARQLASRARRRVQGAPTVPEADLARQRDVVGAFLSAARAGDVAGLLAVLDPAVVLRTDTDAGRPIAPMEIRGAEVIAQRVAQSGARAARAALIDGVAGIVVAPKGKLLMVLRFTIEDGKVRAIDAVGAPERLRGMELAMLG